MCGVGIVVGPWGFGSCAPLSGSRAPGGGERGSAVQFAVRRVVPHGSAWGKGLAANGRSMSWRESGGITSLGEMLLPLTPMHAPAHMATPLEPPDS